MRARLAWGLALLTLTWGGLFAYAGEDHAKQHPKPSPREVLHMLREGNERFASGKPMHPHLSPARLRQAGTEDQGNHAFVTVIGCSDSRVPVESIFDVGVMDMFVIRVAGNVVDVDEAGSIEYGLAHVYTPVLVVLGHTQCGAVTAVYKNSTGRHANLERNIPALVDNISPAVQRALEGKTFASDAEAIDACIVENVWQGIHDLFHESPTARRLVRAGTSQVVGAIYDVGTGKIRWLDEKKPLVILEEVEKQPSKKIEAMADDIVSVEGRWIEEGDIHDLVIEITLQGKGVRFTSNNRLVGRLLRGVNGSFEGNTLTIGFIGENSSATLSKDGLTLTWDTGRIWKKQKT
jgi:carbonic anhydrase